MQNPTIPKPTILVPTIPKLTVLVPTIPKPIVLVPTIPKPTILVPTIPKPTVLVPKVPRISPIVPQTPIRAVPEEIVTTPGTTEKLELKSELMRFITQQSPNLNMLYAAHRFFSEYPDTKQQYLESPEEVASDCWLTARFCEDVFVEDPQGDWLIYYFHVEYLGYHDFTIAIYIKPGPLFPNYDEIYLIDSFSEKYMPRIIHIPPIDFSLLLSPNWPRFYQKYFVQDAVPNTEPSAEFTMKKSRICPNILKCVMTSKIPEIGI